MDVLYKKVILNSLNITFGIGLLALTTSCSEEPIDEPDRTVPKYSIKGTIQYVTAHNLPNFEAPEISFAFANRISEVTPTEATLLTESNSIEEILVTSVPSVDEEVPFEFNAKIVENEQYDFKFRSYFGYNCSVDSNVGDPAIGIAPARDIYIIVKCAEICSYFENGCS